MDYLVDHLMDHLVDHLVCPSYFKSTLGKVKFPIWPLGHSGVYIFSKMAQMSQEGWMSLVLARWSHLGYLCHPVALHHIQFVVLEFLANVSTETFTQVFNFFILEKIK